MIGLVTEGSARNPTMAFSTYLGGQGFDAVTAVATDTAGNTYAAGWTESRDFPLAGPVQATNRGGVEAFVAKLDGSGRLVWATYLGGRGDDRVLGMAVDAAGVCVTGRTDSNDFPVVNAFQAQLVGSRDAFVSCFDHGGSRLRYSTYLGGTGAEEGSAIALDSQGNAYVAGLTTSANFPAVNALQNRSGGLQDAFLAKLDPAGRLVFATYFGGIENDAATAVAVSAAGEAYITGHTYSPNLPVYNALQAQNRGGQDAFVAKFAASGAALVYSTYLGGSGGTAGLPETGAGIAVDASGNAYVTGTTSSPNFPVAAPFRGTRAGTLDAFLAKLNPTGSTLLFSTYLGGSSLEYGTAIALDRAGSAYVSGYTASTDFPVTQPLQGGNAGTYDIFVAKFKSAGSPEFATYLGGRGSDSGLALACDAQNNLYIGGQSLSYDFPQANAFQTWNAGGFGGVVAKLAMGATPRAVSVSPASGSGISQTFTFTFSDDDGYADIREAWVVIHPVINPSQSCFVFYSQTANKLSLLNDSGTAPVGSVTPGVSGILQNSQCTLSAAGSSVAGSGATLALKLAFEFTTAYQGTKYLYAWSIDRSDLASGWYALGTWSVSANHYPPQLTGASPATGSGSGQTFTVVFSDQDGYADIDQVWLVIHPVIQTAQSCFVVYHHAANGMYLVNDFGSAMVGPLVPGTAGTLQNSQCTVKEAGSAGGGTGNTLTLSVAVQFTPAYSGPKSVYTWAVDHQGLASGWYHAGTYGVSFHPPRVESIQPAMGSGTSQTFTLVLSDGDRHTDIEWSWLIINSTINAAAGCFIGYHHPSNALYLANDAGTFAGGPLTPGNTGSLQNSQCVLDGAGSSTSGSGDHITLNFALAFNPTFAGTRNIYAWAVDRSGLPSGWSALGTWMVP